MSKYILGIDPSGNYNEGKGTTGWVLLDTVTNKIITFGSITATDYQNIYDYWDAHIVLIDELAGYHPSVVIEDYRLYHNRAMNQVNSQLETPRLIGVLTYECYKRNYKIALQTAVSVKTRWSDTLLVKKGFMKEKNKRYYIQDRRVSDHIRDALRHAVHLSVFGKEKHE